MIWAIECPVWVVIFVVPHGDCFPIRLWLHSEAQVDGAGGVVHAHGWPIQEWQFVMNDTEGLSM